MSGDHNMNQTDAAWRKRQIALDKKAENARELGLCYEPELIYTTFKQWAEGRFLETGEPRTQAYSKDELALIEMGWGYGCDAGAAKEREACAMACELLDFEPDGEGWTDGVQMCIEAIRARGSNGTN